MNLNILKKFAQEMRREFIAQVGSRLDFVLTHDDEYLRAHVQEKRAIVEREKIIGRDALIDEAAYLWFNRLAAFRYMDARGYTSPRVISPRPGESQPELLAEIKAGRAPDQLKSLSPRLEGLLSGRIRSSQPDREVYMEALLGTCNAWAGAMPWLFSKVEDWAGLLLPQDILSSASLVARMTEGLSESDCTQGVEIIGWLYQFYISEKKDEVFAALKKNVKITKENIPAATQLFTPHWIVRFMVENSLGRLWLLNHPESRLKEKMKYYVESDPEPDFLKVCDPAELKCLDPCCGSGHILAYFFDLLYSMYEEEGYALQEIPSLILQNNIYGIDIDERAAELAAFTLAMVAREKDRRFFERGIVPKVIAMRDIYVDLRKLNVRLSPGLQESLELLKDGRTYGSLIPVPAGASEEIAEVESTLGTHHYDDLFSTSEREDLISAFRILEYLEPRYHAVVTNPPYMNPGVAGPKLKDYVAKHFPDSKSDLFAAFMERSLQALQKYGYMGMINQQSWMFLSSFEGLRKKIIDEDNIIALAHLGSNSFETIGGAVVQSTAFVIKNGISKNFNGTYIRLISYPEPKLKEYKFLEAAKDLDSTTSFIVNQNEFKKIPGMPIAYWFYHADLFLNMRLSSIYFSGGRLKTHNNEKYIRLFWELSDKAINKSNYVFIDNGGEVKKWFGNREEVVNFKKDAKVEYNSHSGLPNLKYWHMVGISWGMITLAKNGFRYKPSNSLYSSGSPTIFPYSNNVLGYLNSKVTDYFLSIINPTFNTSVGEVLKLPYLNQDNHYKDLYWSIISISKSDWDLRETSWDFRLFPLITEYSAQRIDTIIDENLTDWSWPSGFKPGTEIDIAMQFISFKNHWTRLFLELHRNEEENNRIFIDLYGLQDELTPEVPYSEITILQEELVESARKEGRVEFDECVLARQFVSYGVGCLMGRYSVEKDGLILADAGATLEDFTAKVPGARFLPDPDGILPLTDEDDFIDDLPTRFKAWLRFISGDRFEDNLRWIEERLGKDLRAYFIRDFYKEHLRRYKNRPIYWMVTSPSGTFRALLYLHRYTKDSVGKILNDYLRPYRTKLDQKLRGLQSTLDSPSSSQTEKTGARKRIAQLEKNRGELELWEKIALYPTALARIELDLDDGVKFNYRKLGAILEPVKQLEAREED